MSEPSNDADKTSYVTVKPVSTASKRVFAVDIFRGLIIIVMSFCHTVVETVDYGWLLQNPLRLILGIPMMPIAIFNQCRGIFFIISGMVMGFRVIHRWLTDLRLNKPHAVVKMLRTCLLGIIGGAILLPFAILIDFLFCFSLDLGKYARENLTTNFWFEFSQIPSYYFTGPVSVATFCGPICLAIGVLVAASAHKVAQKLWKQQNNSTTEPGEELQKRSFPQLLRANPDYFTVLIFACFSTIICLIIALLRYPVGLGQYKLLLRFGLRYGIPTHPKHKLMASLDRVLDIALPAVHPTRKPNWAATYFMLFIGQFGNSLMGFFPLGMHFFAGMTMGLVIASFVDNKTTTVSEKKRVLWSITGIYSGLIMFFFLVWFAIFPMNLSEPAKPCRFNGSYFLGSLGLASYENIEDLGWHTGPYELWIMAWMTPVAALVTHLCELSDAGRRIQRADDATNGVYDLYKKGKRAPLRWIRRFSTFSATAICFDALTSILLTRASRVWPDLLPYDHTTGKMVSYSIFINYFDIWLVAGVLVILDLVFRGYLSTDYAITLAKSLVSAVITTLIAVSKLASPKVRADIPAWRAALMADLTRIYRSAARPITRQHAGVQFVQCFREDEKLGPRKGCTSTESVLVEY